VQFVRRIMNNKDLRLSQRFRSTIQTKISPPSSGSKKEPSKYLFRAAFLPRLLFGPEDGSRTFLRNTGCVSTGFRAEIFTGQ
jgi:hypothetical protein